MKYFELVLVARFPPVVRAHVAQSTDVEMIQLRDPPRHWAICCPNSAPTSEQNLPAINTRNKQRRALP